jgi:lipopolysaccharide transport system ATP-binding protein
MTAICVENVSKRYRTNVETHGAAYSTLRESIMNGARSCYARLRKGMRSQTEEFWALRDVSFKVEPGEVVGIIGRNGAGKSTLLKVLSRITRPTKGCVKLKGRLGSLLEVGTGFHPELSGRDNVFLNGVVLGMTRREIARHFDAIVEFAELQKFIDTPIKRYSTGMYVRLAFSVAAHINPEILLVDEVLAVGDIAFQKKCLGQMDAVAKGGRTVLFVSHQLEALTSLCPTSLLIENGRLVAKDATKTIIDRYLQSQQKLLHMRLADRPDHVGHQRLRFTDTWLEDMEGRKVLSAMSGQAVKFVVRYELAPDQRVRCPGISFAIYTQRGAPVTRFFSNATAREDFVEDLPSCGRFECLVPRLPLNSGSYIYNVMAEIGPESEAEDWIQGAGAFTVDHGDFYGTGRLIEPKFPTLTDHRWRFCRE